MGASYVPSRPADIVGLKSRFPVYNPRIVFLGDSITAGASGGSGATLAASPDQQHGPGFTTLAAILAGQRVRYVHNAGVPGETTTQILARFDTQVTPYYPGIVHILAGTNDMSTTSGISLATSKANIIAMIEKCYSIGATPILGTIPPKAPSASVTATEIENILKFNDWITQYASQSGLICIDYYRELVDPDTGNYKNSYTFSFGGATGGTITFQVATRVVSGSRVSWTTTATTVNVATSALAWNCTAAQLQAALSTAVNRASSFVVSGSAGAFTVKSHTGCIFDITIATDSLTGKTGTSAVTLTQCYSADGIHPDNDGQIVMANLFTSVVGNYMPLPPSMLPCLSDTGAVTPATRDAGALIRNACMTIDATGDGQPDFYTVNTSHFSYSLATLTGGVGNWAVCTHTTSTTAFPLQHGAVAGTFAVGDRIAVVGRIQTTGFDPGRAMPWVAATKTYVVGIQATGGTTTNYRAASGTVWDISDGWFYVEIPAVPTGTTALTLQVSVAGASGTVIKIGQFQAYNLTTLGVVDIGE